ncbi:MAG: hypothetical protein C0508_11405 [Cyanobacteria bacterium PR.023]|nr:hypothetical protein [Cyanobacteria bacterium PR.023]
MSSGHKRFLLPSEKTINSLIGWLLYPFGDLIGQLLLGKFEPSRILTMTLVGGLLYRFEIPAWFKMLDSISIHGKQLNWIGRTIGAMLYFNPLWIGRHVFFIYLATHQFQVGNDMHSILSVISDCLLVGFKSFLANLPISIIGNLIIQTKLPIKYRFAGSAILSAIFAISYAIEYLLFR